MSMNNIDILRKVAADAEKRAAAKHYANETYDQREARIDRSVELALERATMHGRR